jgi:hypothetical protein
VWHYTIGSYQVIKKWLSYRDQDLLGRSLKPEEVMEFTQMARRTVMDRSSVVWIDPGREGDRGGKECRRYKFNKSSMKSTDYFKEFASRKHPEVQQNWIEQVLANPIKREIQLNNRISYWGNIEEAEGRTLRVITLADGETVHNAFFDRNFLKRQQRGEEPQ